MSPAVETPPARRRWPKPVSAVHLIPEGTPVPKAVAAPAATAREAFGELLAAQDALEEARAYHAEWPELGAEALKEAAERAQRADEAVRLAVEEQAAAITAVQEEWIEQADGAVAAREAQIVTLTEQLDEAFAGLREEVQVAELVKEFSGVPWHWEFPREERSGRAEQREERYREKTVKDVAEAIRRRRHELSFTVGHLTAALAQLAAVAGRRGSGW